jgi:hypothetical protein
MLHAEKDYLPSRGLEERGGGVSTLWSILLCLSLLKMLSSGCIVSILTHIVMALINVL